MGAVKIKAVNEKSFKVSIEGVTPLVQHKWSEKAKQMMRDKHAGKKTKTREVRVPEEEFESATYRTIGGAYGIPVKALKACIIGAAHKDLGVEKTLVRKALFIPCSDPNEVLPMECSDPFMREDYVRVGASTDLRYRPEFKEWKLTFQVDYDADLLSENDIVNLVNRAGFGVGLCEMRPEKGGENGRFRVVVD